MRPSARCSTTALVLVLTLGVAACTTAKPPCSPASCGDDRACLGGSCVTMADLPPRTATRVLVRPVAVAWVGRPKTFGGSGARDPSEPLAQLGGEHGGKLLLRFAIPPPPGPDARDTRLVAAHLVLSRADVDPPLVEGDGPGVTVRSLRIVDAWEARAVTWANQPRTFDVGLPSVWVPWGPRHERIRLDVVAIVRRWPHHDPRDQGIAVEAEGAPALTVSTPELELYYSSGTREENVAPVVQRVSSVPASRTRGDLL